LKVINDMVDKGYVVRSEHAADARIKPLGLTARGRAAVAEARRFHARFERDLGKRIGVKRTAALREALEAQWLTARHQRAKASRNKEAVREEVREQTTRPAPERTTLRLRQGPWTMDTSATATAVVRAFLDRLPAKRGASPAADTLPIPSPSKSVAHQMYKDGEEPHAVHVATCPEPDASPANLVGVSVEKSGFCG
jgi:hypothetical protein